MVTHILSMILVETPAFMRLNASIEPLGPAPTTRTSTKLVWSVDCIFGDGGGGIGMGCLSGFGQLEEDLLVTSHRGEDYIYDRYFKHSDLNGKCRQYVVYD